MMTIYWSDGPDHTLLIDPAEIEAPAPVPAGTGLTGLQFDQLTGLDNQPLEGL